MPTLTSKQGAQGAKGVAKKEFLAGLYQGLGIAIAAVAVAFAAKSLGFRPPR